jgi:hypothetical protein
MGTPNKSQLAKFKKAARDLETDDDEGRFNRKLKKIARQKPPPKKGSRKPR